MVQEVQKYVTDGAFLNAPDPTVDSSNYKYANYLPTFDREYVNEKMIMNVQ
jgi:hypothetical protein